MNDDEFDRLWRADESPAPRDFGRRVMQRIADLPRSAPEPRWRTLVQRLALVAAASLGTAQVLAFIFGLWAATAAAAA